MPFVARIRIGCVPKDGSCVAAVVVLVVVGAVGMRFWVRKMEPRADEEWVDSRAAREVKNWGGGG